MKIRYFAVLAIVSILSIGTITSCSNPNPTQTNTSTNTSTEVKANPCASKANPCASKANADTLKAKSVGGSLAQELQGKPVLVDVFATWCSGCQNIAPTLSQLKQQYSDRVNFVVLDVTDRAKLQETTANAEKLGLGQFLEATKNQTSTVAIVDPATGNILAMFQNNANKGDYTKILDTALAKN